MNCILKTHEQEELLLGYCTAVLEPDKARTYERHTQSCPECKSMLELQRLAEETLADWTAPEVSEDFDRKLFMRIRREEAAQQDSRAWWRFLFLGEWGWKSAVPVTLAAVALAVFLFREPTNLNLAQQGEGLKQQGEGLKSEEIEQVEMALDDMEALHDLHQNDGESGQKEAL